MAEESLSNMWTYDADLVVSESTFTAPRGWVRFRFIIDTATNTYSIQYKAAAAEEALPWVAIPGLSCVDAKLDWTASTMQNPGLWDMFVFVSATSSLAVEGFKVETFSSSGLQASQFGLQSAGCLRIDP
jgi:hypothetical protein